MTADDVHPHEMPDVLDALLDDLRDAAAAVAPPAPGPALASLFRDGAAPVAPPAPARRWVVRAAVAGAVAGLGFGGLGVAGALPAPIQERVADLVEPVGIDLPGDEEDRPAPPAPVTTTTTTTGRTTTRPAPPSADEPSRSGEAPGRSGDAPGQAGDTPGHSGEVHGLSDATPAPPAVRSKGAIRPRRNQTATYDVHRPDRPGRRPADDGGTLR